MREQSNSARNERPTGADVVVHVNTPPGVPPVSPLIAMGLFVSAADQERIDAARRASYELAIARGHVRR